MLSADRVRKPMRPHTELQAAAACRPTTTDPELERKHQFARRVSVSVRAVDNWIRDRKIPYLKVGRTVLIPWKDALDELKRKYRLNATGTGRGLE